jgi:hypothetical protein
MMSPGRKLTAMACHPTKKVSKAVELKDMMSVAELKIKTISIFISFVLFSCP